MGGWNMNELKSSPENKKNTMIPPPESTMHSIYQNFPMLVKYRQSGTFMVLVILKFVTYLPMSELRHTLHYILFKGTDF